MLRVVRPRLRVVTKPTDAFFHAHAHSRYSKNDALSDVAEMVSLVASMGHKGLALTDHGNMSGSVQLYKACAKAGIKPFPGVEAYFVDSRENKKAKRKHLGLVAMTTPGYEALVKLCSRSHQNFYNKPILDWSDLTEWKEQGWTDGIALTTGCYFGVVVQALLQDGERVAKYTAHRLSQLFPHTFIELQRHNIEQPDGMSEQDIANCLYGIAQELGLPVVVTQDSHYCDLADKPLHETLKRVVAFGPDPDEAVFPGDGFHLCDSDWVRSHHEPAHWNAAQEGFKAMLDMHSLVIPELDSYHYNVPQTVEDPEATLSEFCWAELKNRNLPEPYAALLAEELSVITDTRMAGYLLLVKEVTDHCREAGIFTQTRGSATGSLVCWLTGITQYDPIRYKLRYERFVSRDRTKPPDVDLDVEDARRGELLEWLNGRFNVTTIGTHLTYSIDDETGKGSLIVAYKKLARLTDADASNITWGDVPQELRDGMLELSNRKVIKAEGTHAAGVVITSSKWDIDHLVPTMLIASSKSTVTQFYDDDVEALGLVKLDVLGLRTLTLLRRCIELIGRDILDGLDWIPLDDTMTFTTLRNGATAGVFQLEGYTSQRGCKEVKVRSLKDIIVIQALYRPAVMKNGTKDLYIARREGREKQPEMHPILAKHLKETYGLSVFQDQVVAVLRDLGLDPDRLTELLKAIKASQKADMAEATRTIAGHRDHVGVLAERAGLSASEFDFLWAAIEGFAQYGFNRSHATSYGITAYRCAYLKSHYPLEFASALLETVQGKQKEPEYVKAVRDMGFRILNPHVNISGASYSIDRKRRAVRRGLVSIKGVGLKAAEEIAANAPYESVEDLIKRTNARMVTGGKSYAKDGTLNGVLAKLDDVGALSFDG